MSNVNKYHVSSWLQDTETCCTLLLDTDSTPAQVLSLKGHISDLLLGELHGPLFGNAYDRFRVIYRAMDDNYLRTVSHIKLS